MMNTIKSKVLIVCSSLFLLTTPSLSSAQNTLFSKQKTAQKEWVGHSAPDFKLQDQNGKWHTLDQYKGKWIVLYFYPKDDTAGCTQEANQFKALYPEFLQSNAVVLGASLDDVASHQKFSEKLDLPFPILADEKGTLAGKFGIVRNLGISKIAKRESFLIDPKGAVIYHYTSVNTQTHADQVLKDLKNLAKK
ncbi:peroxiredoxin [Acinetobacter haemolyticus]|uniref:peroxiredoxin n=1 Tax=Acinetobacter haemolyticus TaxID=29430 RepID=UPI003F577F6A